jgi:hypothetical protein
MNHIQEAAKLVLGDRNAQYGTPKDDYIKTAKMWSGILAPILSRDIKPEEAILMMIALKLSRLAHQFKDDSLVDLHGYALCYGWVVTGEKPAHWETTPTMSIGEYQKKQANDASKSS